VFFRSPTIASAADLMKGLIGHYGVALPQGIYDHLGPLAGWLHRLGVTSVNSELWTAHEFRRSVMWILASLLIALGCPNTLQILARYEPALGVTPSASEFAGSRIIEWNASVPWAIIVSVAGAIAILSLGGPSEFLYWQF
jgi:alginate O-acetyltransferase complex protein AlgI